MMLIPGVKALGSLFERGFAGRIATQEISGALPEGIGAMRHNPNVDMEAYTFGTYEELNKGVSKPSNLPTVYDPDFAAQQTLKSSTNITPGGRTITLHAAERMVTPPLGRVPTSIAEVDEFLDTATNIRKISQHPLGDTITLRNANSANIKEVVVDAATGKRVITVISPRK